MIPINLHTIASILNAKHIGIDLVINEISIDSNVIKKKSIFIALVGKRFDGHDFVEQAVSSGAKAILVNHRLLLDVPQLIVMDTHCALLKIAYWVRCQVSSKVIAITGSSGKTSVKEITASILKGCGKVIATQDNFNNLIGVPITLLRLTDQSNFAVIELGANKPGELYQLGQIVVPDVALVNNIFPSHLSGFKSLTVIKREKGEIFFGLSSVGQVIINLDNHDFVTWSTMLMGKRIWCFSLYKKIGSHFFASNIQFYKNGMKFLLHSPLGVVPVFLSMLGYHNILNALAASALSFSVGASLSNIINGLYDIRSIPGRLFPILLNKGKLLLLDDSYNSNVGSMIAAIYVLNQMPGYRILVISDMLELGVLQSIRYHCYIGQLIVKMNINQVCTIGNLSYLISKFCKIGKHFQNKAKLIMYINSVLRQHQCLNISILVKGSRGFRMEQVVDAIKDY